MRNRNCAVLMIMLLATTLGWGQQPITFDTVRYNPLNSFNFGVSVFETDEGFVVFGSAGDGTGNAQNLQTSLFNSTGGFLSERTFTNDRLTESGYLDPVTKCASGGYASGLNEFSNGEVIDSLYLYRFNHFGDTVWTAFLMDDSTILVRKTIELNNEELLLVGIHQYPTEAFMFRVGSSGDSIGFKGFGYPAFYANSVAEGNDQELAIAGYGEDSPPYNGVAYIQKCTSEGQVLWRRHRPPSSSFAQVLRTQNGEWVAFGASENAQGHATALICRYSDDGDLIWAKEDIISADNQTRECGFADGFEQPDGTFIVCGTVRNAQLGLFDKGLLYHLDAEGNVLWSRFYSHYAGLPVGYPQRFRDVEPTSDGGFVLTGLTEGISPPNPVRLWLVKLDSMGCLVPGCHTVGVQEFESQLQSALHISPNPASALVSVELALPEGYRLDGAVQTILVDAQGKEVLRQPVSTSTMHLRGTLDVQSLPAGLYYAHLRDPSKWLAGGKVVVE